MGSGNVRRVREWFGIEGVQAAGCASGSIKLPALVGGQIVLITGASGSGKSRLLRRMRKAALTPALSRSTGRGGKRADTGVRPYSRTGRGIRWIDLGRLRLPDRAVVDCFGDMRLEEVLELLGRVGLGEVWTYLRRPGQLSDGQRWRLRLAMALHRAGARPASHCIIAADEFGALLDRVTAMIVAQMLRRTIDNSSGLCAVVASSQEDLIAALRPDVIVRCDFGESKIESLNH